MAELKFFLTSVPFFDSFSSEEIEQIMPLFIERSYERGKTIFWENTKGEEFFIVKSGVVKISRIYGSKEVILATMHEGDYFGEMAVLEYEQVRSATAKVIEKSEFFILQRDDFIPLLEKNPRLTLKLLNIAMERLRRSNEVIKDLTSLDSRSRIFKMILRLSEEYGISEPNGGILIDMKITHQLLADMTSTVRETVTKALAELQANHIIRIVKKRIVIQDRVRLIDRIEH